MFTPSMYRTGFALLAAVTTAASSAVAADKTTQSNLPATDRSFVMDAAQGSMAEVQLGELASEKASRDSVKQLGENVKKDHQQASRKLEEIASNKGVTLPKELSQEDRTAMNRLENLSGEAFDKAYIEHTLRDHRKELDRYRQQARTSSDQDVKQFASNTVPTLEQHMSRSQEIARSIGVSSEPGSVGSQREQSGQYKPGRVEGRQMEDEVNELIPGQPQSQPRGAD